VKIGSAENEPKSSSLGIRHPQVLRANSKTKLICDPERPLGGAASKTSTNRLPSGVMSYCRRPTLPRSRGLGPWERRRWISNHPHSCSWRQSVRNCKAYAWSCSQFHHGGKIPFFPNGGYVQSGDQEIIERSWRRPASAAGRTRI